MARPEGWRWTLHDGRRWANKCNWRNACIDSRPPMMELLLPSQATTLEDSALGCFFRRSPGEQDEASTF